ncbi:helix-turn-helix domain-containing protein [Mesorhizobium sp.]|uniref:helix-turn-helix domain-containing protein n=1 Tax=Mesorhizobium sp. TaxID=1871066 RepID=UPI000FE35CC8|nr:helix-turn-helix domain-containing protein [Mesorhizobium sp.]RWO00960.1 MAG: DNA-binding protein [Mesorhizobium sp.]RWO83071.1 MAG: DNA-binding protein [Mesorhizobium sp.]
MGRHRLDRRKVKIHRSYTIDEAARTIGAAKGTVRRWLDKGMPAIRDRKPILILGADLADHMARQARPKRACPPGTCYCVKCRDARQPDGGMAEFVAINAKSGNLRALCPECGSLMHRRTSHAQLEAIRGFLDVTIVEAPLPINDSGQHSTNDHLQKEPENHA